MKKFFLAFAVALSFFTIPAFTQNFNILKDINASTDSYVSNDYYTFDNRQHSFAVLNGVAYFSAFDGVHSYELWRSDGTASGTYMVKDINTAANGSSYPHSITASGNIIFFSANDDTHGDELWKSDGTDAGTVLVKDIQPGTAGSSPNFLTDVNGTLFFIGNDAVTGTEVWKSDGTDAGTGLVKDITPGLNYQNPIYLTKVKNRLWFVVNSNYSSADGIYTTDGTEAGTRQVFSSLGCGEMHNVGNKVMFVNYDYTSYGSELWVSDGVHTEIVKDIVPGFDGSFPADMVTFKDVLYFSGGANPYYSGSGDRELWRSDGTANGTYQVADIYPGISNSSSPSMLTVAKDQLFFIANSANGTGLWRSDGTAAGTQVMKNFTPATITNITAVGDVVCFSSYTSTAGQELWKSDGTAAGTVQVKDIYQGNTNSSPSYLTNLNNNLLFAAAGAKAGIELWRSAGTDATTKIVKDINTTSTSSSNIFQFVPFNSVAYFFATNPTTGIEPWKTDGTEAGTVLLKDIAPGSLNGADFHFAPFAPAGSNLVFIASDPAYGTELWKTDGTTANTKLLKDITAGTAGSYFPLDPGSSTTELHSNGNKVYFAVSNNPNGGDNNLWVTDGTETGTQYITSVAGASFLRDFAAVGNLMFFNGFSYFADNQLCVSDGTFGGTKVIPGVIPKSASFNTTADGRLLFNTSDNNLWLSDGTSTGTTLLKNGIAITANDYDFYNSKSAVLNGITFFAADDAIAGTEIWRTNGKAAGTVLLKDIYSGSNSSAPNHLTVINGQLFFVATNAENGSELWKSDGTANGTKLVKDITAGAASSYITNLTNANGTLYFSVSDYVSKPVLWKSDGTVAGTVAVEDNNFPSLEIGSFFPWVVINNKMLFPAYTLATGTEPGVGILPAAIAATSGKDPIAAIKSSIAIDVQPNPATSSFRLTINTKAAQNMQLRIVNTLGSLVLSESRQLAAGSSSNTYNCANWAAGIYIIKAMLADGTVKEIKIVKQ